ncbi:MAG: MBL fold metallo-hydrolase [Planctomycetota bacterium]|jgi:glyoxylase-like metal-dependent hydrolase (beta-lactamase superfamily II)
MAKERVAAAIALVTGSGPEARVYLVERARQLRFFGGYHALPGGVLDASDAGDLAGCALRELFEETGVLLDGGMARLPAAERQALREQLLARDGALGSSQPGSSQPGTQDPGNGQDNAWPRLQAASDGSAAMDELCRMMTPPFAPMRYDTVFFLAHLPAGEHPEVWPGELTSGGFHRPKDLLASWRRGEILIVPPVVVLLELLAAADGDMDAFVERARATAAGYEKGKLHRVLFTPGIIMASIRTPTLPPATTTNCYLVGRERLQIVDPGTPYEDELMRLYELLDELVDEGCHLDNILLTHHHPDHVGGVHALAQRFDLPVRAHPLTLDRLKPGFRRGEPLQDGDRIDLGAAPDGSHGWHLQAIFTPGHDRGHHCFRESRYDAVLVGDMLSTVSTIVIDPPEGHLQTYMDSLARLQETPMTTLYPAHGPALPDGHDLVRKYVRHRNLRQNSLAAAVAKGPTTAEELLPQVYWDVPRDLYPIAARSLLAGLEKLREEGRARCEGDMWQVTDPDR